MQKEKYENARRRSRLSNTMDLD